MSVRQPVTDLCHCVTLWPCARRYILLLLFVYVAAVCVNESTLLSSTNCVQWLNVEKV